MSVSIRPSSVAPTALSALLRATHLFGLALGSALGSLRESGATAAKLFARAEEQALLLRMMREAAGILGERWDKVPERHRPHYAPAQRFRVLRIRNLLGFSQCETATMFRVSTETIARWEMEATGADGEGVRPLVAPNPPVRRLAAPANTSSKSGLRAFTRLGARGYVARGLRARPEIRRKYARPYALKAPQFPLRPYMSLYESTRSLGTQRRTYARVAVLRCASAS